MGDSDDQHLKHKMEEAWMKTHEEMNKHMLLSSRGHILCGTPDKAPDDNDVV